MDNLFHALVHAVPTREHFARVPSTVKGLRVIPHFTQYWPKHFNLSVGWRLLVRSLGKSEAEWRQLAAQADELTRPGRCHCFRRLYGGHSAFMPACPPSQRSCQLSGVHARLTHQRTTRRVAAFNHALSASVGISAPKKRILFQVRRTGIRQIVNEEVMRTAVAADATLSTLVHFVVMESLPVMKQYELVSSSLALAGMHGMGLAWTMLLPSNAAPGRTSCLEITGEWKLFARLDYYSMSIANEVHYVRLIQPNWPGCYACKRCNYRSCGNVTMNASDIIYTLRYMAHRLERGDEQGGCARHPSWKLFKFGGVPQMGLPCETIEQRMASLRS